MSEARRFVVKVGSTLVTNRGAGLDASAIARWAGQVAKLRQTGKEIILVSSGAIAEGMQRLGWTRRPSAMHELQAAAAVGQMGLAQAYESCFREHGLRTAQVLLTHADLADRQRYLNARSTLLTLLGLGIIPVINENDTVVTEEIRFGDNDTLAALVTNLVEADCLVILTDQQGLFTADPRVDPGASLIRQAQAGEARLEAIAGGTGSVIASGNEPDVLLRLAAGEAIGTLLSPQTTPLAARKQWLADHVQVAGRLSLDAGAAKALRSGGRSLLPVGVREVEGEFERGAVVACLSPEGAEIARGLVNYNAQESRRIAGRASNEIEAILGYIDGP